MKKYKNTVEVGERWDTVCRENNIEDDKGETYEETIDRMAEDAPGYDELVHLNNEWHRIEGGE